MGSSHMYDVCTYCFGFYTSLSISTVTLCPFHRASRPRPFPRAALLRKGLVVLYSMIRSLVLKQIKDNNCTASTVLL